jgi:iron complex outermembrane receptor protein
MDLYLNYNQKVAQSIQIDVTGGYTYQDFRDSKINRIIILRIIITVESFIPTRYNLQSFLLEQI